MQHDYIVIAGPSREKMEGMVKIQIQSGWILSGGVSIAFDNKGVLHYAQALIK